MKKRVNTDAIKNELEGSVFFPTPRQSTTLPPEENPERLKSENQEIPQAKSPGKQEDAKVLNGENARTQEKLTHVKSPDPLPNKFMSYEELLAIHGRQKSERYTTRMTAALEVVVEKFAWEHDMDNYKVVTEAILEYIKKNR